MGFAIAAKPIEWAESGDGQYWDEGRYGFSIGYDPGRGALERIVRHRKVDMSDFEVLFPIPENRRNADDMGMPPPAENSYTCGYCGYSGPCYGNGFSAPWCYRCGLNNRLVPNDLITSGAQNTDESAA